MAGARPPAYEYDARQGFFTSNAVFAKVGQVTGTALWSSRDNPRRTTAGSNGVNSSITTRAIWQERGST